MRIEPPSNERAARYGAIVCKSQTERADPVEIGKTRARSGLPRPTRFSSSPAHPQFLVECYAREQRVIEYQSEYDYRHAELIARSLEANFTYPGRSGKSPNYMLNVSEITSKDCALRTSRVRIASRKGLREGYM